MRSCACIVFTVVTQCEAALYYLTWCLSQFHKLLAHCLINYCLRIFIIFVKFYIVTVKVCACGHDIGKLLVSEAVSSVSQNGWRFCEYMVQLA